ncbi:MAG: hypothetical protein WBG11_11065 [Methylocella sp.]
MTRKIDIFGALRADLTRLGASEPNVERLAFPKSLDSGNLSLNKLVIRRLPVSGDGSS